MVPKRKKIIDTISEDRILDTLDFGVPVGIIQDISLKVTGEAAQLPWAEMCVEYFFNYSGQKKISNLYQTAIDKLDDMDKVNELIAKVIVNKFNDKWNKFITVFNEDYSVKDSIIYEKIHIASNSDTIDRTVVTDSDSKESSKITTNSTGEDNNSVYGFNSSTPVPESKANSTGNTVTEGLLDDNKVINKRTDDFDETKTFARDETDTYRGHDVPFAELAEKEIEFRNNRILWNIIFDDIDSVTTILIY